MIPHWLKHRYGNWKSFRQDGSPIIVPLVSIGANPAAYRQQRTCVVCNKTKERVL